MHFHDKKTCNPDVPCPFTCGSPCRKGGLCPMIVPREGDVCKNHRNMESCPICMEPVFNRNFFKTSCGHVFHKSCIAQYESKEFKRSLSTLWSCPMCRSIQLNKTATRIHMMTYKSWKKFTNISPEDRSEEIIELLKLLEHNLAMFNENMEQELYEQMQRTVHVQSEDAPVRPSNLSHRMINLQRDVHVQSEQIPTRRTNLLHRMMRLINNMF